MYFYVVKNSMLLFIYFKRNSYNFLAFQIQNWNFDFFYYFKFKYKIEKKKEI